MRLLIQRVSCGAVDIQDKRVKSIGPGLVVLIGIAAGDTEAPIDKMVEKLVNLRIFKDHDGKMNLSSLDVRAEILAISQFTLYADCRKGRRPGFAHAASPDIARPLYELIVERIREFGLPVVTGRFGEYMQVTIHNDGPVTILLDSNELGF
ncbi:MAG: D-aminoacyl-tRNA deacylase [candidate division KSB1 bacterium]|nr:D-aminoacyl-tRNA deacylase [candidate division KSB1 bacterium]